MTARLPIVVLVLAVGHALIAGLYWALLNTPESNLLMLALSAVEVLLLLVAAAWVTTTATLAWDRETPIGAAVRRGVGGVPAFALALIVFMLFWRLAAQGLAWHEAHSGEIDAQLIAWFNWTRTSVLHRAITLLLEVLWAVVGVSVALAALNAVLRRGWTSTAGGRWIGAGFSRVQLGATALAMAACIALPWRYVYWRPRGLAPGAIEIAFLGVKLLAIYLLMNLGWAIVLWAAAKVAIEKTALSSDR